MTCPDERFAPGDLSVDAFLGGALQIAQPKMGYRAGVDPVLLAASVPARAGQSVLELGCGGGVASLCLAHRTGAEVTGIELQPAYAALALENAERNGISMSVALGSIAQMPAKLRQRQFDHVIANPPYYDRTASTPARDQGRETGLGGGALAQWVEAAARRLVPGGTASFVMQAARLPELLSAMDSHLGGIEIQPLAPRVGKSAHLILIRGKKLSRAEFCLHPPIVLHMGAKHDEKRKDYNPLIEAVLREGAALTFAVHT